MLTRGLHTMRQRAQPTSCPSSGERLLLFHPIHLVPAFCPPFTVLHSDGVHKEERETPPLATVASPLCLAVHFEMLLHMIRENLEKSLLQMKQQSLLKVRPPAVRADAHRSAWRVALTPQLLSVSCPPLLEAGKQLKLAPSPSEGFSGEKCGLWPLTAMDSNPASVTQVAQVAQVQSCSLLSACMR